MENLQQLINESANILITTHISPDPDALCSLLLLGTTLKANFPDKSVTMATEELTGDLKALYGYQDVKVGSLPAIIDELKPQLIFIVDAMSYKRCTRSDAETARQSAVAAGAKLVIIDHHEPEGRDVAEVYINQGSPAAVQDVYEVCFDRLGLSKPEGYAQTAMLGLYSDTGGFIYENPRFKDTFKLISELVEAGVSIEKIKFSLETFSLATMKALAEIAANLDQTQSYSFSYLSDETAQELDNFDDAHMAVGLFANDYLRNIEGRQWGFLIYPDLRSGSGVYGVSFRAVAGVKDVSKIANNLGGGGHKAAAGAKIKAASVQEALNVVHQTVEKAGDS